MSMLSADEKTSIQARIRWHPSLPPKPGNGIRVKYEYERGGASSYLAAWDVHRSRVSGHCEPQSGIAAFDRLVAYVMNREPYRSAKRVFWIVDNGSSHRGERSISHLQKKWPNIVVVHLPVHASWLNQIEVYFSIIQRKVLTPNNFESLEAAAHRLYRLQERYEKIARPFEWKFTRADLNEMLEKVNNANVDLPLSA